MFPELTVEAVDPATVAQGFDDLNPDEQDAVEAFLNAANLNSAHVPLSCGSEEVPSG